MGAEIWKIHRYSHHVRLVYKYTYCCPRGAYKGQSEQSNQLNKTFDLLRGKEEKYAIYQGWGNSFLNRLGENGIDTSKWVWIHPIDTPYTNIIGSLDGKYKLRKDVHLIK